MCETKSLDLLTPVTLSTTVRVKNANYLMKNLPRGTWNKVFYAVFQAFHMV